MSFELEFLPRYCGFTKNNAVSLRVSADLRNYNTTFEVAINFFFFFFWEPTTECRLNYGDLLLFLRVMCRVYSLYCC